MRARFLKHILSAMLISEFFILFLTLVNNWIPSTNTVSKSVFPIYLLSPKSFPFMFFNNTTSFNGSLSSTQPVVKTKFKISHLSLIIRCSLNPKNHHIEHLPRLARTSNVLCISMRWLRHTRKGVLSTKLIPVHSPSRTCLMNAVNCNSTSFSSSTKRLYDTVLGKR